MARWLLSGAFLWGAFDRIPYQTYTKRTCQSPLRLLSLHFTHTHSTIELNRFLLLFNRYIYQKWNFIQELLDFTVQGSHYILFFLRKTLNKIKKVILYSLNMICNMICIKIQLYSIKFHGDILERFLDWKKIEDKNKNLKIWRKKIKIVFIMSQKAKNQYTCKNKVLSLV